MPTGWLWNEDDESPRSVDEESPKGKKMASKIGADRDHSLSVSQLNQWVKNTLDRQLYPVWLEGEISDLAKPSSGHLYMTLKDEQSQIRGVMWRSASIKLPFRIEDGMSVFCYGSLDVYAPRGTYQFQIQRMEPKGVGALQLAFQQLHAKLQKEGLFDPARKKPLPNFPRRIGFVTSPSGAAIHDFLEVLRRRWRGIEVLIIPSKVQGEGAAEEIARGIRVAGRIRPPLDLLIVGRGGGSVEDLWAFNEEPVVRAIAESPLPTVSAVGHEIDVTLCDLAADVRALTPTEAAERILPDADELMTLLQRTQSHVQHLVQNQVLLLKRRLEQIATRPVLFKPEESLHRRIQRVDELQMRADRGVERCMEKQSKRLEQAIVTLEALSPLRVLSRGYSVTRRLDTHDVIQNASQLNEGELIETLLAAGKIQSRVVHSS